MKKRGLIVATIVMVLVLAVSLTTATYAWFQTVTKTTVESISFSVGADSDVNIGLLTNHTLKSNSTDATIDKTKAASAFMWGDMDFVSGAWTGGTVGLGYMIDTQLQLDDIEKAVGTGVVANGETPENTDSSWVNTNSIIKATAGTDGKGKEVQAAEMQKDYLDVIFGVNASKEKVDEIICVITVNPTLGTVLGMNAAIHVRWSLDGLTYYDCDIYSPETSSGAVYSETESNAYSDLISKGGQAIAANGDHTGYTAGAGYLGQGIAVKEGWASIAITVAKKTGEQTQLPVNGTPTQIHLQIFIAGYDSDCNNNAMGVASDILINFIAKKSA